jgi:hypothetical protein
LEHFSTRGTFYWEEGKSKQLVPLPKGRYSVKLNSPSGHFYIPYLFDSILPATLIITGFKLIDLNLHLIMRKSKNSFHGIPGGAGEPGKNYSKYQLTS